MPVPGIPGPVQVDVAAGGLLEDGRDGEIKIAIIFRPRYNDWTLPKGHVDPGETIKQAALREVQEETGCSGEIVQIVQPVSYLVKGQPKIVVFFRMKVTTHGTLTPNDEVSEVKWVSPGEALEQLTNRTERDLIRMSYGG